MSLAQAALLLAGMGGLCVSLQAGPLIIANDSSRNWYLSAPSATATLAATIHVRDGASTYLRTAVFGRGNPIRLTLEPNSWITFHQGGTRPEERDGIDQPFSLTDSDGRRLSPSSGNEDYDLKIINWPAEPALKNRNAVQMITFRKPGDLDKAGRFHSFSWFSIKQPACQSVRLFEDQARAPLGGDVGPEPLEKDKYTVAEANQKHEMHEKP